MIAINRKKSNYNGSDTSIICIACKPQYKAVMMIDIPYAVESCTII